ncbi:MAG TPA: hypothetical protein PKA58_05395 [Polyangium sp.]|nr:hypothetical protein [Polyangium sp.]
MSGIADTHEGAVNFAAEDRMGFTGTRNVPCLLEARVFFLGIRLEHAYHSTPALIRVWRQSHLAGAA